MGVTFLKAGVLFFPLSHSANGAGSRRPWGPGWQEGIVSQPALLAGFFWSINLAPRGQPSPAPPPPATEEEGGGGRPGWPLHLRGEPRGEGLHLRGWGGVFSSPRELASCKEHRETAPRARGLLG